jgi:hypothetical protein
MEGFLEVLLNVKGKVLSKVKKLMMQDYTVFLLMTKKRQKIKVNERIVRVMMLLIHLNKVPSDELFNSPEMRAMYLKVSSQTRRRDFDKLRDLNLIIEFEENGIKYIKPNYQILEGCVLNLVEN